MNDLLMMRAGVIDNASPALRQIQQNLNGLSRSGNTGAVNNQLRLLQGTMQGVARESRAMFLGLVGFGAAGGAISGIANLARELRGLAHRALDIAHLGRETGMTTREIRNFTTAAEKMRIAPEAAQQALGTFAKNMFALRHNLQGGVQEELHRRGASDLVARLRLLKGTREQIEAVYQRGEEIGRRFGMQAKMQFFQDIFGHAELARLSLDELRKTFAKAADGADADEARWQRYNNSIINLEKSYGRLKRSFMEPLTGPMAQLFERLSNALQTPQNRETRMPDGSVITGKEEGKLFKERFLKPMQPRSELDAEIEQKRKQLSELPADAPKIMRRGLIDEIDRLEKELAQASKGASTKAVKEFAEGARTASPEIEKRGREGGEAAGKSILDGLKSFFRPQSFSAGSPGVDGQVIRASLGGVSGSMSRFPLRYDGAFPGGSNEALSRFGFRGGESGGSSASGGPSYSGARSLPKGGADSLPGGLPAVGGPGASSSGRWTGDKMLDAIIEAEGTAKGGRDPFNTVLGYGKYGTPDKPLTEMTLKEVYDFGRKMRQHPANPFNSSAAGAFQIVGRTMKDVAMPRTGLGWDDKFTPDNQMKMARAIAQAQGFGAWEGFKNNPAALAKARRGGSYDLNAGKSGQFERVGGSPFMAPKGSGDQRSDIQTSGAGKYSEVGNFARRGSHNVDPRMRHILEETAKRGGYNVEAFSGFRPGSSGRHGRGDATDIWLRDKDGKLIPNYQNAAGFPHYEKFAQDAKRVQQELYPNLNDRFRWGGYFGGPKGKYGALDSMHFDLGGNAMAGGSWAKGLTEMQKRFFPGIRSEGMGEDYRGQRIARPEPVDATAGAATNRYLAGEAGFNVNGRASIDVNVNAPRGTTVNTEASGLFRDVKTTRSMQMPTASDGPAESFGGAGSQPY